MVKFPLVFALSSVLILKTECATPLASSSTEDNNSRQAEKNASDIIKNDKIRETYVKCLLDKGPCSQEAAHLKS